MVRLVREPALADPGKVFWDPQSQILDASELSGIDAAVHLSGKPIDCRWTRRAKEEITSSRIGSTEFLCRTLASMPEPPRVMVCSSGVGFYGDAGPALLAEESPCGSGFLAQLCKDWEDACSVLCQRGVRVVNMRLGVVLSTAGGALAKMLPAFRLGCGAKLGSGTQYMSWIVLDDVLRVIEFMLGCADLSGPVNACSPLSVTNAEFTQTLAHALGRCAVLSLPEFSLKMLFGEMAKEVLMSSQRASAQKLIDAGFVFTHKNLRDALDFLLNFEKLR